MTNFYRFIFISMGLHICVFLQINQKPKRLLKEKPQTKVSIKLKKVIKKFQTKTQTSRPKKLSLSSLAFNPKNLRMEDLEIHQINDLNLQKQNIVFNHIDQYLIYPTELIENEIYGFVTAEIFIDKNLQYLENKTKIKGSSRYLNVHIARVLRLALKSLNQKELNIKKLTRFNLLFEFRLTTSKELLEKSKITDQYFFFYRQEYGAVKNQDKINKAFGKALLHITNWFSLLEYLPDSDEKKLKKAWKLRSYEYDRFY